MLTSHISDIAIIQSIPPGERQTGKELSEDIEFVKLTSNREIGVKLYDVRNKDELFFCLERLTEEAKNGSWPLLQIDCHGSKGGTRLADGSFVTWDELKPSITKLNIATRCNLFVLMTACFGGYLIDCIEVTDRSPCWGLIGPTNKIFPDEVYSGVYRFYRAFFETLSGDASVKSLVEQPLGTGGYSLVLAPNFFKEVYAKYIQAECSKEAIEKRARRMSRKDKKRNGGQGRSVGHFKRVLVRTQPEYFARYSTTFFMSDLYPENKQRFDIQYSEIIRTQN